MKKIILALTSINLLIATSVFAMDEHADTGMIIQRTLNKYYYFDGKLNASAKDDDRPGKAKIIRTPASVTKTTKTDKIDFYYYDSDNVPKLWQK